VESPAGRHEALVALARAVFAEGGRMAVPVDTDVALVIGMVALEYAQPPVAVRRAEPAPAPLLVRETASPEYAARLLLAPLTARGALRYLDGEGEEVTVDPGALATERVAFDEVRRHRVTPEMVRATSPSVAVVISPAWPARRDLDVLREFDVPTVVFGRTVLDPDLAEMLATVDDPTERLLGETPRGRWSGEDTPEEVRPVLPYPYLMQRLVAEWTDRRG
jgi:hypothetical protein